MRIRWWSIAMVVTSLVAFGAGSAAAHQRPSTVAMGARGASQIHVVTSSKTFTMRGTGRWQSIPGAAVKLDVPAGRGSGLILARFNAVQQMDGSVDTFAMRVVVDGVPMNPAGKFPFGGAGEYALPLEIDRAATVPPGPHTVTVQAFIDSQWLWNFRGWAFTVEEARAT